MQNINDCPEELINNDENETDGRFSREVKDYQNRVVDIIVWLISREEELRQRVPVSELQEAAFSQVLNEYSIHEKFIGEFCDYRQIIKKCREDGQELRENENLLSEEDRDEIGIQMDTMMVHYEKLNILALDRLCELRSIVEVRQQTKIERFEEWLAAIEVKISSLNNIGPDYESILQQLKEMNDFRVELEQKQDFLNFLSSVIIFDEIDSNFSHLKSRSCDILDERLESMNRRWTEICRFVNDRNDRLKKAESVWKLLNLESPQLATWLKRIMSSLTEVLEVARSSSDVADQVFMTKLLARSDKIDSEIKNKQIFYTSLETRVRREIEKFDDPCSMLVIELEKKLEDMQDNWNTMMNRKRMLDYTLQALTKPSTDQLNCNMIPLPDPITSNGDLRFSGPLDMSEISRSNQNSPSGLDSSIGPLSNSLSFANDERDSVHHINGSLQEARTFDNSLSSDTKSLIYGNVHGQRQASFTNDSQDELSSTSITTSYPTNMLSTVSDDLQFACHQSSVITHNQEKLHLYNQFPEVQSSLSHIHNSSSTHNCRVEEWKISLESFSTWLKQVESSLGIESNLETVIESGPSRWSQLDLNRQLLLLNEIESKISSTCQDEFDCLILQGQQIIEDLIPEIGENEYEANLKEILADIEIRYATVKRCLYQRKQGMANKDKWHQLLKSLRNSCDYLIKQMSQVLPESNIGIDLITLAQQQDELMHAKAELADNSLIQSSIQEAKSFLRLCDMLQGQQNQFHCSQSSDKIDRGEKLKTSINSVDEDIWLSLKDIREDIENQLDRLTLHYSELSQLIEDRLTHLDQVHKEMHALQHQMQELAARLQVAEILRSNWSSLDNLTIEKLSEQLEDLKLFRERLIEVESIHGNMNSIFDWMTESDVPLSQQNLKRISELNTIWSLIQVSVDERQKQIEQAFDNQGASEQRFLTETVADLPRWERRVATSRVPYFIDHDSNKTIWDHPKFIELLKEMTCINQVVFSAYRTALKLRVIQKKLGIDLLMLEQLKEILENQKIAGIQEQAQNEIDRPTQSVYSSDMLIGVEQIIFYLKAIYEKIQTEENSSLNIPLSIDLTLNWLLNLYDS